MGSDQDAGRLPVNHVAEAGDLDMFEANTHPFVVKVWLEETAAEAGHARWRGYITHVPSGERRYVEALDEINAFIASYLEGMGVNLDLGQRVKRWLKGRKESSHEQGE
jgi:hypothetical protein